MKILITGGAGMVGSHVAEFYARQGAEVIVFDNLGRSKLFQSKQPSVEHTWAMLKQLKTVRCVQGDVKSAREVERVFEKDLDAVVHAAAQPGVRFSIEDPVADFEINALGTLNVLEAARRHAPRAAFIYCSTNKVYGGNVGQFPLKEEPRRYAFRDGRPITEQLSTDRTTHTPYGVSK